jgi:hypothetical protein
MRHPLRQLQVTALAGLSTYCQKLFVICRTRVRIVRRYLGIHAAAAPP